MYELMCALFQMNVGDDVVGELDYGHHGRFGPRHRASVPDLAQQETVQEKCQVRLRSNFGYYTSVCMYIDRSMCMYVCTVCRPKYIYLYVCMCCI